MNLWNSFKKWIVRDITKANEEEAQLFHSMVGEPVISFIESLHREGNRRYKFSFIKRAEYKGEKHHWMNENGFRQMVDVKTNSVYQLYVFDDSLYNVVGLPFDLNGWEKNALIHAWMTYRQKARQRLAKMRHDRYRREREAAYAQEKLDREQFAKQFRVGYSNE